MNNKGLQKPLNIKKKYLKINIFIVIQNIRNRDLVLKNEFQKLLSNTFDTDIAI